MNAAGSAENDALEPYRRKRRRQARVPGDVAADLRAPNEDDDGYDPYSDYMDALARRQDEEPSEDPWR